MRLYNTLTRQPETFEPLRDGTVRMYTCGLTVYARGHIGNFRTFVCVDVLRRTLKYVGGWKMRHVMNFTDVDDKTIAGAQREGKGLREYTDQYVEAFRDDAAKLGIEPVEETPRATDQANLDAMAKDDPATRGAGPHLPERRFDLLQDCDSARIRKAGAAGSRGHPGQARAWTPTNTTRRTRATSCCGRPPRRVSRRGTAASGRAGPGWHIECSAMALRLLGESPIDIHTGGIDLVFPHHENEIAQSEGATGLPFSRFWVHVEHLLVDDQKMSKSLGNFYTLSDITARGIPHLGAPLPAAVVALSQAAQLHVDRDAAGRGGAPPADRLPGPPRRGAGRRRTRRSCAPPAPRARRSTRRCPTT